MAGLRGVVHPVVVKAISFDLDLLSGQTVVRAEGCVVCDICGTWTYFIQNNCSTLLGTGALGGRRCTPYLIRQTSFTRYMHYKLASDANTYNKLQRNKAQALPWNKLIEDGNVVVNLGLMALGNALGNPHNVAHLLLLELDIGVEDAMVELLHERHLVQVDLPE